MTVDGTTSKVEKFEVQLQVCARGKESFNIGY